MKRIILLIALLGLLTACGGEANVPEETAVNTPPETSETANQPTATPPPPPTDIPPTATVVQAITATPATEDAITPVEPTAAPTAIPAAPATRIELVPVAGGLVWPLGLTHADDNRIFIVGKQGIIEILRNGQRLPTRFLDITGRVGTANEQGLLGMAVDPNFAQNGRFYIHYSDLSGNTVISRYTVSASDPNVADPNSEQIILTITQPYRNHNGGQIKFSPDGYLYIGMGDGGSQDDPQNLAQSGASLLGKMLRIDVSGDGGYAIPADNPFVGEASFADEIWSIGFRNPWRFSFDRLTGDMFIADVGQNRFEEVSFQPASSSGGENYGWRPYEGDSCYFGQECTFNAVPTVAELSHEEGNCSITGGYIYRGEQFPELWGNYFFTDLCGGIIYSLFQTESGEWVKTAVYEGIGGVASFGEDANGELYVMTLEADGQLYQIQSP